MPTDATVIHFDSIDDFAAALIHGDDTGDPDISQARVQCPHCRRICAVRDCLPTGAPGRIYCAGCRLPFRVN